MDSFLKMVAKDLYERMQGDLSRTVVVFPNKRARLYFDEHLAREAGAPIWSPTYTSISELLSSMSEKEIGDPVRLVCELYRVFKAQCKSEETLDEFYFWGEMLLNDFNDVDKSMVDAKRLFSNLEALKDMSGDLSFLTEEQAEAARAFFHNFNRGEHTELKERFSSIWNKLYRIYEDFRSALEAQGLTYEGMLYREAVEQLDTSKLTYEKYAFVGFNVLTKVEHSLFEELRKAGKAIFYWDYDTFYVERLNHEAGTFLAQNIKDFPSPLTEERFNAFARPKRIEFIEAPTENAQARYLPQWLTENITETERDTAVVLCNEALLSPVLHSLPKEVEHVNITMGYPLAQTPAYSFLNALLEAHTQGYNRERRTFRLSRVTALLRHPFVNRLTPMAAETEKKLTKVNRIYPRAEELWGDETLQHLFTPTEENNEALCALMTWALEAVAQTYRQLTPQEEADPLLPIYKESIFKAYTVVNRFHELIQEGEFAVIKTETFCSLLQSAMRTERIPFHGEPAEGVQIMGVIETRNLDFRHLIMLSVNEGFMPRVANDVSFIPYNLRKAFGMTTIEHKISVYAYYFYRLLQRAERVTLVYNAVTDGRHKGEWSRFLLQLLVDSKQKIERYQLEAKQKPQTTSPIVVRKTEEVMKRLHERYDMDGGKGQTLSPSALNAYIDCPLRFYYRYVAGLKTPETADEEVDNAMFGTIFHATAESIYNDLTASGERTITREMLAPFLNDKKVRIKAYVDRAFNEEFLQTKADAKVDYNGLQLINKDVIAQYVYLLLKLDWQNAPFEFIKAEENVKEAFEVKTQEGTMRINIGGIIDRQDRTGDGTLRIVDYKTGGNPKEYKTVEELFEQKKDRANYIFQIFLYSSIMRRRHPDVRLQPCLLYINHAAAEGYEPLIKKGKEGVTEFVEEDEFLEALGRLLSEQLFNKGCPFTQTTVEDNCKYCDFKSLCHKGE